MAGSGTDRTVRGGTPNHDVAVRTGTPRRVFLAVITAGLLVALVAQAAFAGNDLARQAQAATARYNSVVQATRAGYGPFPAGVPLHECIMSLDGSGGMGFHYVNGGLIDGEVDELNPEVLVYAPKSNGRLQLVALEYVIFDSAVPEGTTPTVFGRDMTLVAAPNRYEIPSFWQRHIWLYEPNEAGLFADFNPSVSC